MVRAIDKGATSYVEMKSLGKAHTHALKKYKTSLTILTKNNLSEINN